MESLGICCELVSLNDALPAQQSCTTTTTAQVLIARNALCVLFEDEDINSLMLREQLQLNWDTKAKMYGRVVNKRARHNLCYADEGQQADYDAGRGTIIAFSDVPLLAQLRGILGDVIAGAQWLAAEGNLYYDSSKCGIGFHGDAERRKVIAVRLGSPMPLDYQWFKQNLPIGRRVELVINPGDLYFMSEKATGNDCKKRKIPTLRHAAGSKSFRTIKKKKAKKKKV